MYLQKRKENNKKELRKKESKTRVLKKKKVLKKSQLSKEIKRNIFGRLSLTSNFTRLKPPGLNIFCNPKFNNFIF